MLDASSEDVSLPELSADSSESAQEGEAEHPLCHAAANRQVDVIQQLLEAGADANARDKRHGFALQAAAMFGFDEVAKLLIEHGADVNSPTGPNGTAIELARSRGHKNTLDLLLKSGAIDRHDGTSARAPVFFVDDFDMKRATDCVRRIWMHHFPEVLLPLRAGSIKHFEDAAWLVHRLLKNGVSFTNPYLPTEDPSKEPTLGGSWGEFIDEQGQPVGRLGQWLLAIANYLIEDCEPQHSIVISSDKMHFFFAEYQLESEEWPWNEVFHDEFSSISRLYREFEIEHHLIQGEDRFGDRPDLPGLTPRGFAKFLGVLLQSYPKGEKERLRRIASSSQFLNHDERVELAPVELPELLPRASNSPLRERLGVAIREHCRIVSKADHSSNSGQQFQYPLPLSAGVINKFEWRLVDSDILLRIADIVFRLSTIWGR